MEIRKKSRHRRLGGILGALILVAVIVWFLSSVGSLAQGRSQQDRKQLEDALRRAAVACYAAEGMYPPNLEYMVEHYGVQINEERYAVFYDIFAENLMPDITVLELP